MRRRPAVSALAEWASLCLRALAALAGLAAAPALGQTALTVNGTLVIQGGGTNTSTVRYMQATVDTGTASTAISLSPAFPTLVIRGPQAYAVTCQAAGDCWDSNLCLESTPAMLSTETTPATPGTPGVCGWSGIELPAQCGDQSALNSKLDDCADLWIIQRRNQASIPNISTRTDQCAGTGTQIAALSATCPVQQFRDAWGKVVFDVIAGSQSRAVTGTGPLSVADVQTQLKIIGDWYGAFRQLNPASGGDAANTLVWSQTSRIVGGFWNMINTAAGVPPAATQNPSDALLDGLFQKALEADRTVLVAALTNLPGTSQPPITTAPLIEVLGDGLQTFSDRLAQVGLFQDLGCRFRADSGAALTPSCRNGQVRTEIGELARFMASLNDPVALATLIGQPADSTTAFSTGTWANWRTVFSDWNSSSSIVSNAVVDAFPGVPGYTPELLAPTPTSKFQPTPPTAGLTSIIQNAQAKIRNLDASGLFDPSSVGVLHAGIQDDRVSAVMNQAQALANDLNSKIQTFKTDRLTLANNILSEMANAGQRQDIIDQITTRLTQDGHLSTDVAGLRTMIEVEEARFGDFLNAYGNLLQFNTDPNTAIQHHTLTVTARPADAQWPSATTPMLSNTPLSSFVKAGGPILSAQAGDTVQITTTGQWLPTCALSTAPFSGEQLPPNVTNSQISLANALTGPEGFLLQLNAGQYSAVSNTSVHENGSFANDTNSTKSCAGASASFDPIGALTDGIFSLGASASEDFCHSHDTGTTIRDTQSNSISSSSDSRLSANFTTGLRLKSTPFTTFPAGSLLLLEVKGGGTTRDALIDAHVLQEPSSAFLIGSWTDATGAVQKNVDLYLAVNDLSCPAPDTRPLTLVINQTQPLGSITVQLGKGMSKALSDLRAQEPALLAQGRIGPEQMTSLRANAYDDLRTSCSDTNGSNCSLSFYPPQIQTFFDTWISKELANIERKADLLSNQRQLEVLRLQGKQLSDDLNSAQSQARLLLLVPDVILKDLATHVLQTSTRNVLNLMIGELFPIIDLRAPGTLSDALLDPSFLDQLVGRGSLQHLDWSGDLTVWISTAASATSNITQALQHTINNQVTPVDGFIALGFFNPNYVAPPGVQATPGSWNHVSPQRAKAVWDAFADSTKTTFSIQLLPSDIWSASGGTDVLVCSEATPVITAFEVYMVRPGQFENYEPLQLPMQIDGNLEFPSVSQDKFYRLSNPDWLNQGIQVQSGEAEGTNGMLSLVSAKMSGTATPLYRAGNGLSPFTKFDITIGGLITQPNGKNPPVVNASELVLVFRVQSRNVAGLHLAPMCP